MIALAGGVDVFNSETVLARMRERPFRPVRFVASEGLHFDIHHQDLVLVGQRDVIIGFPRSDNPAIYDRTFRLALVHLVGMEDLPTPASGTTDGAAHP